MGNKSCLCAKCYGLVFWDEEQKLFYCSTNSKTKGGKCSADPWSVSDIDEDAGVTPTEFIKMAKDQGERYKYPYLV